MAFKMLNRGGLFKNRDKSNELHPDYTGDLNVDGKLITKRYISYHNDLYYPFYINHIFYEIKGKYLNEKTR